jgi:hypothetical protein
MSNHQTVKFLANGMGTVNAADYKESLHGPALTLSDDEYDQKYAGRFHAIPAAPNHPPTTLPNLHTGPVKKV